MHFISVAALSVFAAGVFAAQPASKWEQTIERVSSSIVTIRIDVTRAFDTEWNTTSQATGFIVDAERGLILTNRHVAQPGPVIAEAIFRNKEEVALKPVYRDPVHDFGIFQYNPADLRYLKPKSISLVPERAEIGREIRVIGNDAGEQLSILAGTIARLDREAPDYGRGGYNDFNTFYIQAASSTSGGSSGSPVVDIDGNAVALNAGGHTSAATSFFLPLDRVVRALNLVRDNQTVTRGTLQTTFVHRPYDELRRLGLREQTESLLRGRFPGETGMLVVADVVPQGPGSLALEPGDILVRLNGRVLTSFIPLEDVLDSHVGETVTMQIERGGVPQEVSLTVQDLHAVTPDTYLEFGGAVVNTLSYQQARHLHVAPHGVFVANAGYVFGTAGIPRGSVITSIDGNPVNTIDEFQEYLETLADGARATIRFFAFDEPGRETLGIMNMDWRWFPAQRCKRNDATGLWDCIVLQARNGKLSMQPVNASFPSYEDARANRLANSLVFVNFDMPYLIDGVDGAHYYGTGLIVDAGRGLVLVDRNTVPVALGDVRLTFAGSVEIPARVEFVHPLHNLAMISYDPVLIGDTPVRSAELNVRDLKQGDDVWVVGYKADQTISVQATEVASIDPVRFPLSSTFRFREANLETVSLVNPPEEIDGVLADKQGKVVSLWSSFAYQSGRSVAQTNMGVSADLIDEFLELVRANGDNYLRSVEVEFYYIPLSSARKLGLPEEWARKLERADAQKRRVLAVARLVAGAPSAAVLREGDLLLAVDGKPVNSFRAVEKAVQKPAVELTIFRNDQVRELVVNTAVLDGKETDRVVVWSGAQLQHPHRAVAAQRGILREGIFVAFYNFGSPASRYGLVPGRRIIEVDGEPTPDLDAFLQAVSEKQHREAVRLKTMSWDGRAEVITLKTDFHYWPTYEIRLVDDEWERIDY
ncbi:MAG: PDZ domain-containing protein [Gammaproteobacteria bacterium]|nr:PDZ domain-containing protein [Gammaproteobacteria bacterium]